MGQGVATTKVEYIEVFNDGRTRRGRAPATGAAMPRWNAFFASIMHVAALKTRVGRDLMTLQRLRTPGLRVGGGYNVRQWPPLGTGLVRSSDCPVPAPDQMPIGHPSWPRQWSLGRRSDAPGQEPAPCRRRRQLAKASSRSGENEPFKSGSKDRGAKAQRPKEAGKTQTES